MKRLFLLLALSAGLMNSSFAQVRLGVISAPGLPDTCIMNQQVTYLVVTRNNGTVTHFGSYQINIGVWDSLNQQPVVVHAANQQPASGSLAPGDNDTVLVTHTIDSAVYRAGGNTIVIWPTPPGGTEIDSLYKETYVIVFNDLTELAAEAMVIYPNPATDYLFIRSENAIEQVRIFDLNGKLIQSLEEGASIDLSGLCQGMYVVLVTDNRGNQKHFKLKKQ
jgi:hypothetical protein